MKIKQLINLLSTCNLDAKINFKPSKSTIISISSKAICKCKQKEVNLNIGVLNFEK